MNILVSILYLVFLVFAVVMFVKMTMKGSN